MEQGFYPVCTQRVAAVDFPCHKKNKNKIDQHSDARTSFMSDHIQLSLVPFGMKSGHIFDSIFSIWQSLKYHNSVLSDLIVETS